MFIESNGEFPLQIKVKCNEYVMYVFATVTLK